MPEVELSAGAVEYLDTGGPGPVAVLVHGLLMDATLWSAVVDRLRAEMRCVVPTLPFGSHRRAMRPNADLSLAGHVRLLGELLDTLDLRDVTLVAGDLGFPLALAAERPPRLSRLVVCPCEAFDNIPPGLPGRMAALAGRLPGGLYLGAQALRVGRLRRLPFVLGRMARRPLDPALIEGWTRPCRTDAGVRRDLAKYIRARDHALLGAACERLRDFDRPTLVVWAAEDRVMPPAHGRRLAALIPGALHEEIADSYTLVQLDQPEELARRILRFVAAGRPAASAPATTPAAHSPAASTG